MDWKLHVIVSMIMYTVLVSFLQFSFFYSLQAILLLIFASLLPDIDHPKSIIRKIFFIAVFYSSMVFIVLSTDFGIEAKVVILGMVLVLCYYLFKNLPLSHRGKKSLHMWRYVFIVGMIAAVLFAIWNINISFALFIIIGYASHMLADKIKKF
ncbi:MAG: metal-dependent hydrolase [Candidatus Aenigmarchaeota archaeon]|nr:metal-dependent hydrolase [Candidatus Aenigmarchaeota archaeon]